MVWVMMAPDIVNDTKLQYITASDSFVPYITSIRVHYGRPSIRSPQGSIFLTTEAEQYKKNCGGCARCFIKKAS
jgi:hypothetical protein